MTDKMLRGKIKEALAASGHNRHDAHKLLLTWAVRDPALLLSMTKPHLKAISAGLVDHYIRQYGAEGNDGAGEDDASPDKISRTTIDDIVSSGKRIPTDKRRNTPIPPPKSTERQASTMRKLAAAFTKKK